MPVEILKRFEVPTPFGLVELPEIVVPAPFEVPKVEVDERRRKTLMHAVGADLGSIIPLVGDVVEDLHLAEIKNILTSDEYAKYIKETKFGPCTIALIKMWTK